MALSVAVLAETAKGEARVAATPETVKKLTALGCAVTVEAGAGAGSHIADTLYKDAGAKIAKDATGAVKGADIILRVAAPGATEVEDYPKGALLCALMAPHANADVVGAAAKAGVNALAMEYMPRISRAQAMDVLSSQANLAGYKAVLEAANAYGRAMPMMMTAAGTVPAARVFVMGVGVAGLQAIATARRLGAIVSATDVRPATKEQVASLGASFIAVEDEEFKAAETAGGYAKEMSAEYKKKQAELVASHIAKQDIVITTALIPGRPAPRLITGDMVKTMRPGSVIVDMAVESGGNCEGSQVGKAVVKNGVTILGYADLPSRLAANASSLYARNVLNLLKLFIEEGGTLNLDKDEEIAKATLLTRDGQVVHPNLITEQKESSPEDKPKTTRKKKEA
ncbi:MAG TPA: Re/Si-specific NAD(P)(+) transhydrogenase subunit alpha [Rhodospirillaceae bacterium]|jgi:NAD(P) transhydrogenase subunit alpha|nr:Re/Si-specific NAD(P)(+) transhydrogenase subunit alpha [Alphaproteobacteria bacterium]HBH26391.1 Re/Si-specific NAD(P)(+) transhydrogenase subunit alpha [Rhodospirillaceae bacterium]